MRNRAVICALMEAEMVATKLTAMLLAASALSFAAIAEERKLTGQEIRETFAGTASDGYDLDDRIRYKVEIRKDGSLRLIYNYYSPQPIELKGNWTVEGDHWCRAVRASPRFKSPGSPKKCQTVIEEDGAYIFIDPNGTRVSRIYARDIRKR